MLRFPITGELSTALPLNDLLAAELVEVLLDDESAAVTRLCQAMRLEPALAVWSVLILEASGAAVVSVADAAERIRRSLPNRLRWPAHERAVSATAAQLRRWRSLALHDVRVSREASTELSGKRAEEAELLGLVSGAQQWLSSNRSESSIPSAALNGAPLAARLARLAPRKLDSDPVVAAVQRVRRRVSREQRLASKLPEVAGRWSLENEEIAAQGRRALPLAARRAAELQELRERFDAELEQQKMEAIKDLAYGASHEINNPLNNIANRADTLIRREENSDRRRSLAAIVSQAYRAFEMTSDMMLFAKPPRVHLETVDVAELARRVLEELRDQASRQSTLLVYPAESHSCSADRAHLGAALRALCLNSLEAMGNGGRLEIKVRSSNDSGGTVTIEVIDEGPGVPDSIRTNIFNPYFSGREAGRGLGLGLSKCWTIVQQHAGKIEVESKEGRGAVFRITLPRGEARRAAS